MRRWLRLRRSFGRKLALKPPGLLKISLALYLLWMGATGRAAAPVPRVVNPAVVNPRVVLFVLDRVGLSDLYDARTQAPHLQRFFRENAVGLMNFAAAGSRTPEGSYASLSAGTHAVMPSEGALFRDAGEPFEGGLARDAFLRRTGERVNAGTTLNLGIAALLKMNKDKATCATLGALGALASAYGPTVALGNGAAPGVEEKELRLAPMIAARPSGVVDRGETSARLLHPDPVAPFGVATDPARLEAEFLRLAPNASLVALDLGETSRVEAYRDQLPSSLRPVRRREALARADALFGRLLARLDLRRTRVIVLTPYPPLPDDGVAGKLTPVAMSGWGRGLLTSPTTQGTGLIANVDLAPTVAEFLKASLPAVRAVSLPDSPMEGTSMAFRRSADSLAALQRLDAAVQTEWDAASGPFILIFTALTVLLGLLGLWVAARPARRVPFARWGGRLALCAAVGMPLALVFAAEQRPVGLSALTGWSLAFTGAFAASFTLLRARAVPAALLACGLALLADLFAGGWGLRLSPLSDFPVVGVRFHGLANEYMGIVIGAVLMGAAALTDGFPGLRNTRGGRSFLGLLFAASALAIGYPTLGANAGGLIAAVFGFGAFILGLWERRLSVRYLIALLVTALIALGAIAALDSLGGSPTHLGHSLNLAASEGPGYLWSLVSRKALLNLRFLTDFRAILVYLGAAALAVYAGRHQGDRFRALMTARPGLAMGMKAALVGATAAWLFNDTGVVPASILLGAVLIATLDALLEVPERPGPALIHIQFQGRD